MEEEKHRTEGSRYVGIDLGKREYTMAIIGKKGKMSIHHGKTSIQGRQALYDKLETTDKVALEAGNLAFIMAREIMERVGSEVRVLNSAKLPFIWDAPTKTDKEDAMKLAHLIEERRDEKLPIVPLPSEKEMERRKVIASYGREMRNRTRQINTLHAIFVAHVGDGSRFSKGAQVSNYIGFVPHLDYSGTIQRNGHITKRGNAYLRGLLVQAAWSMMRCKKQERALRVRYNVRVVRGLKQRFNPVSLNSSPVRQ